RPQSEEGQDPGRGGAAAGRAREGGRDHGGGERRACGSRRRHSGTKGSVRRAQAASASSSHSCRAVHVSPKRSRNAGGRSPTVKKRATRNGSPRGSGSGGRRIDAARSRAVSPTVSTSSRIIAST